MQTYTQTLAAGQQWSLEVPGSYFRLMDAAAAVDVAFYRQGVKLPLGDIRAVLSGLWASPRGGFDRVTITASAAGSVAVGIGDGQAGYDRQQGSVTVTNVNGVFFNAAKTVTNASAQLQAANALRRYLLIQNKDAAGAIFVTLDGTAATTANGVKIPPGGSYELQAFVPVGAIMAIGDIASNANIVTVEG